MFRISAVRFISRQLTGARIRPGVIALLICVYLNESKPCRITAHNCSVPLLDHSLTTSFLPLSPSVSILCFHSLPCLFILHVMPTALFCLFLSHCPLLHPSLPTDYRQPSHAVHLFCVRRRSSESRPVSQISLSTSFSFY